MQLLSAQTLGDELRLHSFQRSFLVYSLFSLVQPLSRVWLFAIPWTAACQASLSITNSQSLLNSCPLSQWCHPTISSSVVPFSSLPSIFPNIRVFPSKSVLRIRWQKDWSFSFTTVLPVNIQDGFPLGWTGWISLQSNRLSGVFSNTTVQKHQFSSAQLLL